MRRATWVARKTLVELWREPQLLALTLLLPLFFLGLCYLGYSAPRPTTHTLLVVAPDPRAAPLVDALRSDRYLDGRPAFRVELLERAEPADDRLRDGSAAALVLLTPRESGVVSATLRGDGTAMRFTAASVRLETLIADYNQRASGTPPPAVLVERSIAPPLPRAEADIYAPGMMVFGILLLVPQTAILAARERRAGTLRRLRLAGVRAWELLAGVSAAQLVVGAAAVLLVFGGALLLGFRPAGSLALALAAALGLGFSAIGAGLIVAAFSGSDSDATNIGGVVAMLMVFLSGAFFPMPPLTLFWLAGHSVGSYDAIPATHGMVALQQALIDGADGAQVGFRLAMMLALSALYFALGIAVFGRRQMRGDA